MLKRWITSLTAMVVSALTTTHAHTEPLNVAPGQDPGGRAVAVISKPYALTAPEVIDTLARDGEGVAIGWDFSKSDQPTGGEGASPPNDTDAVLAPQPDVITRLTREPNVRLVPVFVSDSSRGTSFAKALSFVARTPAQIVVVGDGIMSQAENKTLEAAANHFSHLLFIVPATMEAASKQETLPFPAARKLNNILRVTNDPSRQKADVTIDSRGANLTGDGVLAAIVRTLLVCSGKTLSDSTTITKLDALAALGGHASDTRPAGPGTHTLVVTPCASAHQ